MQRNTRISSLRWSIQLPQPHGLPLHVHSIPSNPGSASMTINDLTAALQDLSSRASTPVASVCYCGRNNCESLLEWEETRARLEKELVLSAGWLVISIIFVYNRLIVYFRGRPRTASSPMKQSSQTPTEMKPYFTNLRSGLDR